MRGENVEGRTGALFALAAKMDGRGEGGER